MWGESKLKGLYREYLDGAITRRQFLVSASALGVSAYAAGALADELEPFAARKRHESPVRKLSGTGGELLVEQLLSADIEYLFVNPATGATPVFDALVDTENLQIISSVHEGALVSMADGYARCSGKVPFVMISRAGLPNAMTQIYNAWKDDIPLVLTVNGASEDSYGQDGFQDIAHLGEMTRPITKWHWRVQTLESIPEVTRRAIKFASTRPGGPVFVSYPADLLLRRGEATIIDQDRFAVSMKIRPEKEQVRRIARLLLQARNPLLYVGSEITTSRAEEVVLELAELLAIPVALAGGRYPLHWSIPFPSRHPLYVGEYQSQMRFIGTPDLILNIGGKMPTSGAKQLINKDARLIQIRMDPESIARVYPTDISVVADVKLAIQDLLVELRESESSPVESKNRERRLAKLGDHNRERYEHYNAIAARRANNHPLSIERVLSEMESTLEKDTCIVAEADSAAGSLHALLSFGGAEKQYLSNTGLALGWGAGAAFGVKLAEPDRPVVALVGDGAFLFSGPQPLWSCARYQAGITVIVFNNNSYNGERNRMWMQGGRQFATGRDMVCYLGDPDVDFVLLARGVGVSGEIVSEANMVAGALRRAMRANEQGKPYLIDARVERGGIGAKSEWHPAFSIHDSKGAVE